MKINIYYGGRGLLDDPTLYVISKIENVLKELRVKVERYNIYEHKNEIATLPQTFRDVDGIILATTVEWLGIGGYMQQFLDACWLYGDKEKISNTYMQPIVMSTTYGEREAETTLCNAWEILGGLPCSGLCGYVEESEQLSKYVSDDTYVKQQKEDIEELATMFKDMLGQQASTDDMPYIKELEAHFIPLREFKACYSFNIEGIKNPLYIKVDEDKLDIHYGEEDIVDVYAKFSKSIMESIIDGHMTFQRAFMTGEMTAKGNFKTLRMLDQIFPF